MKEWILSLERAQEGFFRHFEGPCMEGPGPITVIDKKEYEKLLEHTKKLVEPILDLVRKQADDEGLWAMKVQAVHTIQEAMLQAALRHLHAVIEGDEKMAEFYSKQYGVE